MSGTEQTNTRLVGVLIGDVSYDFTTELMDGISNAASEAGVHVLFLLGMQKHSAQEKVSDLTHLAINNNSIYDYVGLTSADAFIVACGALSGFSGEGQYRVFLERFGDKPHVVLQERILANPEHSTYIVVDNYHSFSQCIEHLIVEHGYRNIALVSGPEGHADARERKRAYLDCMSHHNLPVTPEMIAEGDFYEFADELVSHLIDQNPGLEAIAFANDEMAKAGYRECHRRGLAIGRDIAITGFDNFSAGRSMEPPLTTVAQDTYRMGKTALETTIRLMDGQTVPPLEMRTEFLHRQSCGCLREQLCLTLSMEDEQSGQWMDRAIDQLLQGYADNFTREERPRCVLALRECFLHIRDLALQTADDGINFEALSEFLNSFFSIHEHPLLLLAQNLETFMLQLLCAPKLTPKIQKFASAISYMQQYIHTREVRALEERYEAYRKQSWIAPELTRGLFGDSDDEHVYGSIAERMLSVGLRQVYICLLENPQRYGAKGMAAMPEHMRLAMHATPLETKIYGHEAASALDKRHPFRDMPGFCDTPSMMSFSIYSGENQYGILLCETDSSKSTLLQVIGLQLGMLMDFLELRRQEHNISAELEKIREANEILNFLSEYDQLCGLLNRRGFIERAIRLNRDNIGKTAYCAFMDLDYLKQINDTYGHKEGDLALQAVSEILRNITNESDLIGRIGGDEFVGLFLTEDPWFEEHMILSLRKACDRYNERAKRPYLLDVSIGIVRFQCTQGVEVSSVIADADKYLYEAKRRRTTNALRHNPARDGAPV
ncbi:MAG TPA: GGDEF domain-containing protein [Candidatus Limiplasma sp.]|nr:GGDEF domain-containing protein [Candidatus Limiplasma sp.]HPS80606.1 GGDEF domain-containing protein [Candidatus Limiplasma sp.]